MSGAPGSASARTPADSTLESLGNERDGIGALPVGCEDSVVGVAEQLPTVLSLHPCYPNPFNPQATISFDLPASRPVRLTIYTVEGKAVTTLVNEVMPWALRKDLTWGTTAPDDDPGSQCQAVWTPVPVKQG